MNTLRTSKKKGKKGKKDEKKAVFGVGLDPNSNEVPIVLRKVVEYFQTTGVNIEGLFRISGAMSQMHALKAAFEDGDDVDMSEVLDPHVCASLLKQYFREMPEPLLTYEFYDCFLAAASVPPEVAVEKVKSVLKLLPIGNRITVKYLVQFLSRVSKSSDVNKMTPSNIAIVFSPNLLKPVGDDVGMQIDDTPYSNKLMELFVMYYDEIFLDEPDPGFTPGALPVGRAAQSVRTERTARMDAILSPRQQRASRRIMAEQLNPVVVERELTEEEISNLMTQARLAPVIRGNRTRKNTDHTERLSASGSSLQVPASETAAATPTASSSSPTTLTSSPKSSPSLLPATPTTPFAAPVPASPAPPEPSYPKSSSSSLSSSIDSTERQQLTSSLNIDLPTYSMRGRRGRGRGTAGVNDTSRQPAPGASSTSGDSILKANSAPAQQSSPSVARGGAASGRGTHSSRGSTSNTTSAGAHSHAQAGAGRAQPQATRSDDKSSPTVSISSSAPVASSLLSSGSTATTKRPPPATGAAAQSGSSLIAPSSATSSGGGSGAGRGGGVGVGGGGGGGGRGTRSPSGPKRGPLAPAIPGVATPEQKTPALLSSGTMRPGASGTTARSPGVPPLGGLPKAASVATVTRRADATPGGAPSRLAVPAVASSGTATSKPPPSASAGITSASSSGGAMSKPTPSGGIAKAAPSPTTSTATTAKAAVKPSTTSSATQDPPGASDGAEGAARSRRKAGQWTASTVEASPISKEQALSNVAADAAAGEDGPRRRSYTVDACT